MKRMITLLLALLLAMGCAYAVSEEQYHPGSAGDDFALTTWDGKQVTLSGALAEKELVLLHFWMGGCGACEAEMPHLQAFWEEYGDRVAVIAVTISAQDTDAKLKNYCTRRGLTFAVARDTAGLQQQYAVTGVPVSIVMDRSGTMVALKTGAMASAAEYTSLVEAHLSPEEAQPEVHAMRWGDTPADIPGVQPERLSEALNASGGSLAFSNPADGATWPMIPAQDGRGRMGVTSTNALQDESQSAVTAMVAAQAGDALAITFSLSAEEVFDRFCIRVNGEIVKVFTGERPMMTWAWAVPADGAYALELAYEKDAADHAGEDAVFIDEIALLTGDAAAAALAANLAYPVAGANTLTVQGNAVQQILFDDPTFALLSLFGLADYCIVPGTADVLTTLTAAVDPEGAYIAAGDEVYGLAALAAADGYRLSVPVGDGYTVLQLYPAPDAGLMDVRTVVIFPDAAAVDVFVSSCQADGLNVRGWDVLTFSADDGGAP